MQKRKDPRIVFGPLKHGIVFTGLLRKLTIVRVAALGTLVVILSVVCGGGAQSQSTSAVPQTPLEAPSQSTSAVPQTSLEEMLGLLPLVRNMPDERFPMIFFSDIRMFKDVYNIPDEDAFDAMLEAFPPGDAYSNGIVLTLIGYPPHHGEVLQMRDAFGYDFLSPERTIWIQRVRDSLGVMEGPFVGAFALKLPSLGYQEFSYSGARHFSNGLGDFEIALGVGVINVLNRLNRIGMRDDRMVATASSAIAEEVVDVWNGDLPNAASDSSLRELAQGLGDVLNAVLLPSSKVRHPNFDFLALVMSPDDKENFLSKLRSYSPLHPYDWIGSAVTVRDAEPVSLLALHYRDPGAADEDKGELLRRMEGYEFPHLGGVNLFNEHCSSLSATAEVVEKGSVLLITCVGSLGHRLLMDMFSRRDAFFLLTDPASVPVQQ